MERFIEAVRQYPCIWNINDKDYRHGDKKETAWNEIVGLNIPEIKD
ncbi:jg18740, partial [Pararge aegeria aegeria]